MKSKLAAKIFIFIMFLLAIFQLALILGAPFGRFAWGGQQEHITTALKAGSLLAILLYVLFSIFILDRSEIKRFFNNRKISYFGTWFVVAYSFLGIIMNAASRSHAERYTMTPTVIILFIASLIVARSSQKQSSG